MVDSVNIDVHNTIEAVDIQVTGVDRVSLNITDQIDHVSLTVNETGMRGPVGPKGDSGASQLEISSDPGNTIEMRGDGLFAEPEWTLTDW